MNKTGKPQSERPVDPDCPEISDRTLERDIPELKEYLRPGAAVLDIGCGSGAITLDVAEAVRPGQAIGVDPNEERIEIAREWMAQHPYIENVSFQVGDSHDLNFPDDTFNIVYSHTVLNFFLDPVKALKEQVRVAKKGGWVVASGVRDHLVTGRYPACPHWHQVVQALDRYHRHQLELHQSSGDDPMAYQKHQAEDDATAMVYYNMSAGRKCPELFHKAGIRDLEIQVKAERTQYPGSDYMESSSWDILLLREPETSGEKKFVSWLDRMLAEGFLDKEMLDRAIEEARAWYADPRAFNFWTLVFAAGTA